MAGNILHMLPLLGNDVPVVQRELDQNPSCPIPALIRLYCNETSVKEADLIRKFAYKTVSTLPRDRWIEEASRGVTLDMVMSGSSRLGDTLLGAGVTAPRRKARVYGASANRPVSVVAE